jgi:hypothetical protein
MARFVSVAAVIVRDQDDGLAVEPCLKDHRVQGRLLTS